MAQSNTDNIVVIGGIPYRSFKKDYVELKKMIRDNGILERQPFYYMIKMLEVVVLFSISIAVLVLFNDIIWLQMLNAAFLGFASTQAAYIVHDAGHRTIFRNPKNDNIVGMLFSNLLMGSSNGWWIDYHNEHHRAPNELHTDPAIDLPFWAFDDETAIEKSGFWRFMVRWQAYLYIPLMLFQAFFLRINTFTHLTQKGKVKHRVPEIVLTVIHMVVYFGLLFTLLPFGWALAFVFIHHAVTGVYLGMIFAPNHKGMPTIEEGAEVDFMLQQTVTTRNVAPTPIVDYLFGGLNYQIEHHLFPGTPRNKLGEARKLTMDFCKERGVPYHELSWYESYREMFEDMNETGKQTVRPSVAAPGD